MANGLYTILPKLACNPLQDLSEGMTQKGLLNIIFPNGEGMFSWFRSFNEKSLGKLGILSKFKGASLNIDRPIPGIFGSKGRGR